MSKKYAVASLRTVSRRLGMPRFLLVLDLLVLTKIVENATTSIEGIV